ncbi:MAG: YfiR family protein [Vicinamibacterales bacterium]
MTRRAHHSAIRQLLLGLVALAAAIRPTGAQTVSAPDLKAAFLFNFARFADWPALPPDAPIQVCVSGDERLASALAATLRGQSTENHGLAVTRLAAGDASWRACQVLFIGGADKPRIAKLVEDAGALPILTVSDADRFAEAGGMIELYLDNGRMRFAINIDAVQRSRVRLSSRLLGLAKIVRDPHVQ